MSSRWATLYLLRLVRTTSYGVDISNFWNFPYWGVDCSFGTWSFVLVIVDICYVVQNVACFETILRLLSFLARDRRTSRYVLLHQVFFAQNVVLLVFLFTFGSPFWYKLRFGVTWRMCACILIFFGAAGRGKMVRYRFIGESIKFKIPILYVMD